MLSPLHPMSVDVSQPGEDWKISSVPLSVLYFCSWKEWQLFRYKVVSVQGHMLRHFWSGYGFHLFSSPGDNSYWEPHIVPSILLYPRYIIRCMKWTENSSLHLIWKWTVCDIVSTTSVPGLIIQLITCTHSSCHARQGAWLLCMLAESTHIQTVSGLFTSHLCRSCKNAPAEKCRIGQIHQAHILLLVPHTGLDPAIHGQESTHIMSLAHLLYPAAGLQDHLKLF